MNAGRYRWLFLTETMQALGRRCPHRALILDGTGNSRTLVDRYRNKTGGNLLICARQPYSLSQISPLAWLSAPAGFPSRRSPANGARPHDRASFFSDQAIASSSSILRPHRVRHHLGPGRPCLAAASAYSPAVIVGPRHKGNWPRHRHIYDA